MNFELDKTIYFRRYTHNSSGALADADSAPTADWQENGAAAVTTGVTVTNVSTGEYEIAIALTAANGFEVGKIYDVAFKATVGAVASAQGVATFMIVQAPGEAGTVAATVASYDNDMVPLQATVLGRTLDVSATGEADANVVTWLASAPNALSFGRVDVSVGSMAANTVTASALAADAVTEIAAAISVPTAAANADAVWDEARSGHVAAGSFGEGVVVSSLATAALEAIRDKLLDYSYRSGRTVRGLFRRWGAALEFVTGLKGSTVTYKQPDNATTEFSVTQDPTNGNRTAVTVTNSETP